MYKINMELRLAEEEAEYEKLQMQALEESDVDLEEDLGDKSTSKTVAQIRRKMIKIFEFERIEKELDPVILDDYEDVRTFFRKELGTDQFNEETR